MSRPSDTLTTHSSTATSVRACPAVLMDSLARHAISGSRSRSTTTRSPASGRCGSRRCSTTRSSPRRGGADSLWLSDHLFLDIGKYGGSRSPRRLFRTDHDAGHARAARTRRPPRHAGAARSAASGGRAGQGARDARPRQRRPARCRSRRGLVRTRVRRRSA